MSSLRRASPIALGVLAAAAVGCADASPGVPVDGDDELAGFRAYDFGAYTLEITVREARGHTPLLAGARCVLDLGDGIMDGISDRSGKVRFDVPPLHDRLSVVCARRHGTGVVDFGRADLEDDALELFIPIDEARPTPGRLEGSIRTPGEPGEIFVVQATRQVGPSFESPAHEYQLEVERGVPFALLAMRYRLPDAWPTHHFGIDVTGWGAWFHRPIGREARFDVDFGDEVEPTRVSGSIGLPRDTEGDSQLWAPDMWGQAVVFAKDAYGGAMLGLATETSFAEGRERMFYAAESYEGLYADEDVLTQFVVASKQHAHAPYSVVLVEGYPPIGAMHDRFLDPPYALAPASVVHLEGAEVRWAPDETQPNVLVVEDPNGHTLWLNLAGEGYEMIVPRLPSRGLLLGPTGLAARLLTVEVGDLDGFYERVAASRELRFVR
jgi:hypothetical protein